MVALDIHTCNQFFSGIFLLIVREIGTIIRSLGCYPSEAELRDMIQEVEEEEPTGFIRLDKFQPMMARVLLEKRFVASSYVHA